MKSNPLKFKFANNHSNTHIFYHYVKNWDEMRFLLSKRSQNSIFGDDIIMWTLRFRFSGKCWR